MNVQAAAAPSESPNPSAANRAIEAESLTKVYGARRAIDNLTFSAERGEILGFLGPNGAGKTTTMRILAGYTPATSGRAAIAGHDVARDSMAARRRLGYLPENNPLYLDMRVKDYLNFMCEAKRCPAGNRARQVGQAIEECGLGDAARRVIGNLSKGFRQRVGLAQAVLGEPEVLILDEPTVGLDPRQIAEIRSLIKGMAGRRTVLLSTHILPEVGMTCQKVVVINEGKVVAWGTPEHLVSGGGGSEPIAVTVAGDAARAAEIVARVAGVERVEPRPSHAEGQSALRAFAREGADPRAEIAKALVESGMGLLEINRVGRSLEEVFLKAISQPEEI